MSNASMWRTDSPIIAPDGSIQAGGMWDTQRACWNSENYIKAFLAGYGCVAANTKIVTEEGLRRIDEIDHPMRVLSWDEQTSSYVYSLTGGSFPKGVATLHRVSTKYGSFTATANHRVLCKDGTYTYVDELKAGTTLARCRYEDAHVAAYREYDERAIAYAKKWAKRNRDVCLPYCRDVDIHAAPPRAELNHSARTRNDVESIEKHDGEYVYWDMQVMDTHNYVTEDGCVHHNSGKSMLLGKRVIASALHNAPVPVMMVSPSYRQAKRTIIPTLLSLLNGRKITYKYNRADATVDITHQGVTGHIWIGSGDTPDSLKGSNLGAVYADEAFMLDYSVIEICLSRIRDPRAKLRELFLCGTPENGVTGWAYDMLEGAKRKNFDIGVYQASTLENKALPKEFVESLLAAYDEKTREAYVHGKLVNMSSGTIYGSFDKERHVRSVPVPRDAAVFAGVDFNFDPACAVLFYEDGAGRMMVFDEVHMTGGHDTFELADEVWQKSHGLLTTFFPDPSGTQRKTSARVGTTDITILQQAGMRLRDDGKPFEVRARRRTPPRRDRYNAANSMLREDRVVIDPRCEHLIKSLMMGTYEGFSKHDGYDHQTDSFSYYIELTNPITNKVQNSRQWY